MIQGRVDRKEGGWGIGLTRAGSGGGGGEEGGQEGGGCGGGDGNWEREMGRGQWGGGDWEEQRGGGDGEGAMGRRWGGGNEKAEMRRGRRRSKRRGDFTDGYDGMPMWT